MQADSVVERRHSRLAPAHRERGGKLLFASLFVVVLPALLVVWAARLDRWLDWPVPRWPAAAVALLVAGISMVGVSMFTLSLKGEGLPMSAYPPKRLVTQGPYRLVRHPIYAATVAVALGASLLAHSSAGLFVVTPILAAAIISYVIGYEGPGLRQRFEGDAGDFSALLSLPAPTSARPSRLQQLTLAAALFASWMLAGYLIDYARDLSTPGFTADWGPYRVLWAIPVLALCAWITLCPTERLLRRVTESATAAVLAGVFSYVVAPLLGVDASAAWFRWALIAGVGVTGAGLPNLWTQLLSLAEWVANSRRDWRFFEGRFRIISHAIFSGLAGALGIAIGAIVLGDSLAALMAGTLLVVGAGLFAQVLWSSPTLMRPFGYWGAVLGALVAGVLGRFTFNLSTTVMVLACVMAAPFVQAIGRLRCLAQGCCHGLPTSAHAGIRVDQPQSRVVALSGLGGVPILPTQIYSIVFNGFLGTFLVALFRSGSVSATFIIGMYLILTGVERFAEDAYRGEKQTRWLGPLRENQWIALVAATAGVGVTFIASSPPGPAGVSFDGSLVLSMLCGGLLAAFAMSMDFPRATFRYARLSG